MTNRGKVLYTWNGDFAIGYQVVGEGPVDLLYLPAWGSHLDWNWQLPEHAQFMRRLASFSRVILTDPRGIGASDRMPPDRTPTLEERVDDILTVLDTVNTRHAAVFASHGMGFVAMLAAASHPDLISSLILFHCSPVWTRKDDMPWETSEDVSMAVIRSMQQATSGDDWARDFVRRNLPSARRDERIVSFLASLARMTTGPGAIISETKSHYDLDLRSILPAISVPTLVLSREDEKLWPVQSGRYIADHILGARFVEFPGADTLVWVGEWEPIVGEIQEFLTGTRGPAVTEPDRLLATVLFTDIVGATEMMASLGDGRWKDLVERHHGLVREELARYRGVEVDTAGDGFYATFDGPARAIRCARSIAERVRPLGIEIRAGLHAGECEVIAGKLGGLTVSLGARVAAKAHPSEVLVSQTVRDLVAGSGLEFEDAGSHKLKGLPGVWKLFRVVQG